MNPDEEYFHSYEDLEVHRLMLQDLVRTNSYKQAIEANAEKIKNKIVMDVGAGTGILSLFCAAAGAEKIYAVEASGIAKTLSQVFKDNGFSDKIEVIHSKVEDITADVKVDVVVSEWMGFYLLHESMLDSVLFARDKFLKPGGFMFPESASIYASPCSLPQSLVDQTKFWTEPQFGFDLSAFNNSSKHRTKPEIEYIASENLLSEPQLLWTLDLRVISPSEIQCLKDRRFLSIEENGEVSAVCFWFTCSFPTPETHDELALSTAPWDSETHWKQTLVIFPEATDYEADDIIGWEIKLERSSVPGKLGRSYDIQLTLLDPETEIHPVPCSCGSVKCEIIRHYTNSNPERHSTPSS